jgi:NAD(P)H-hydrate epimerase
MDVIPVCELPRLPRRPLDGHKGTFGTVQVIAGSRGMTGAAVLVGRAAQRAGAGLVRVACPATLQDVVATGSPCYTTFGIRQHTDGTFGDGAAEELIEHARTADVVAIGPGLGQGEGVASFVNTVVRGLPEMPIVLDADGLNAVAPFSGELPERAEPLILTPHPGEFARLLGVSVKEVIEKRELLAVEFAARAGVVLLLKGANTLVSERVAGSPGAQSGTHPQAKLLRNTTGNPGMATGGSGDVLTGVIAALVGQGLGAFDAAALGAWVHGRAGDIAAARLGQTGLIATDILDHLPLAFRELEANW